MRVAVFGPNPLLTVAVEARGAADDVHVHAGGQGVWVARMAAELGGAPILCGLAGGEPGTPLRALLAELPIECRLTPTAGPTGAYVVDRRTGERQLLAHAPAPPPTRHELDDLLSATTAAALSAGVLAICNAYPGDALPADVYRTLAADARAGGAVAIADLSSPRADRALEGGLDLLKLNDWELAGYLFGPVDGPRLLDGARKLQQAGAQRVLVTRGPERALYLDEHEQPRWVVTPAFERGAREGCGDSMFGAIAACVARGIAWDDAIVMGAGAGAANFLRHGLGTGERAVVEQLAAQVRLEPYDGG